MDSTTNPKGENKRKDKELGHAPWFITFWGRKTCWSFEIRNRKSDKEFNYSHRLAQTKQQVG
jgi:hypothetical protein